MPVKTQIPYDHGHYFISFTCHKWLPLFELVKGYDLVYTWFDVLKQHCHLVTGFVIMPNHIHVMIAFRKTAKCINKIVGDGKRFIAYAIIQRLKEKGAVKLLRELEKAVCYSDQKRGKRHEIWEDSFDWKECRNRSFTSQKLNYMHDNPCTGKWMLAENPADYIHSSARYYITGEHGVYPVLNFLELEDIDLSIPICGESLPNTLPGKRLA